MEYFLGEYTKFGLDLIITTKRIKSRNNLKEYGHVEKLVSSPNFDYLFGPFEYNFSELENDELLKSFYEFLLDHPKSPKKTKLNVHIKKFCKIFFTT